MSNMRPPYTETIRQMEAARDAAGRTLDAARKATDAIRQRLIPFGLRRAERQEEAARAAYDEIREGLLWEWTKFYATPEGRAASAAHAADVAAADAARIAAEAARLRGLSDADLVAEVTRRQCLVCGYG